MAYDDYRDLMDLPRPVSGHHPMAREGRAKQFAPFAALKGYEESVKAKEILYDERRLLSEESREEIDRRLHLIKEGMTLEVTWFSEEREVIPRGHYLRLKGTVMFFKDDYLRVDETEINVRDIVELESEAFEDRSPDL